VEERTTQSSAVIYYWSSPAESFLDSGRVRAHGHIFMIFKCGLLFNERRGLPTTVPSKSQSYVTTDGQPVSLSWCQAPKPKTRYLSLSDSCEFVDVWRPFLREDVSLVYNCCWSSTAQSFSGPSPLGLMITFYCLRFETPPTWRARSPCASVRIWTRSGPSLLPLHVAVCSLVRKQLPALTESRYWVTGERRAPGMQCCRTFV
jgi:hypothetical protein